LSTDASKTPQPSAVVADLSIPLFSDQWIHDASHFHFDSLRDALVGMLARTGNPTPFVILIDGKWGAGKTTLMRTVMSCLEPAITRDHLRLAKFPPDDPVSRLADTTPLRFAPVALLERSVKVLREKGTLPEHARTLDEAGQAAARRVAWFSQVVGRFPKGKAECGKEVEGFYKSIRPVRCVFFNAWKYKDEGEIFPALAHELLASMRADGWLAAFQALTQEVAGTEWREAVARLAEAVPHAGGALAATVRRPDWLREVSLYDRARPYIQALAASWASTYGLRADSAPDRLKQMLVDDVRNVAAHIRGLRGSKVKPSESLPGIVAIFVDDLDRCPKENVREVLKAINLLVDLEACAFVLGADHERVAAASAGDVKTGTRFLGKIVQLHLSLPEPGVDELQAYLQTILDPESDNPLMKLLADRRDLLVAGIPRNPREIKRFLNMALVWLFLVRQTDHDQKQALERVSVQLLKYLLVTFELPRCLRLDRELLLKLQEHAGGLGPRHPESAESGIATEAGRMSVDVDMIAGMASDRGSKDVAQTVEPEIWRRILKVLASEPELPLDEVALRRFATLGGPAPGVEVSVEEVQEQKQRRLVRAGEASGLAAKLIDGVLSRPDGGGAPGEALLGVVRELRLGWDKDTAKEVKALLEEKQLSLPQLEKLGASAQGALVAALDSPEIAERADALAYAMLLRDLAYGALDRPKGRSPDAPDPWVKSWWKEEQSRLEEQLEASTTTGDPVEAGEVWKRQDAWDGARVFSDTKGLSWCLVPAGRFIAGDLQAPGAPLPRVEEISRPFWIAVDPVTVGQFKQFVGKGYDLSRKCWAPFGDAAGEVLEKRKAPNGWVSQRRKTDHPVVGISWFEAAAYCRWLNELRTGSCEGPYRLPTEREWERSSRGMFGRCWPFGCVWRPDRVVCREEGSAATQLSPVSENLNRSPSYVRGMAGNCLEWTASVWRAGVLDETGQISGRDVTEQGVLRGGTFSSDRDGVRCAFRFGLGAWGRDVVRGFRCVRDVK